jgi:hypothetical protein
LIARVPEGVPLVARLKDQAAWPADHDLLAVTDLPSIMNRTLMLPREPGRPVTRADRFEAMVSVFVVTV